MRALFAFCLAALSVMTYATYRPTSLQTFTSPDGVFRFRYSSVLIHCTLQQGKEGYPGSWTPADSCMSQDGICDDALSSGNTIACFAYPKDDFKDKPEFSAAAFFVAEVHSATTPESCMKGSPNWLAEKTQSTKIRSVSAKLFSISDAGTSGRQTGEIYRVFRGGTCYEFGIQQASASAAAFDRGTIKRFTKQDADKVYSALKQAVDSFTFLK